MQYVEKMKKYFISYGWRKRIVKDLLIGFGNCIKTSIDNSITYNEIQKWENEIKNSFPLNDNLRIYILNFQEIKG